jgi:hypothetical protein
MIYELDYELVRLLRKEEYDDLIEDLNENSILFLERYYDYMQDLKRRPNTYNDTAEDYQIYKEILADIKIEELLESQHIKTININNYFETQYGIITERINKIKKINTKYFNQRCEERTKELAEV